MRENKPQQKSLKFTRNATNRNKHINEASKRSFANNLSKHHVNTRNVCFPIGRFVSMSSTYYDKSLSNLNETNETV